MDTLQLPSTFPRTRPAAKQHGELPLVCFTVLSQMAAGSFVLLAWFSWRGSGASSLLSLGPTAAFLSVVMGAGLLLSFLHLGSPLRAYRALANLRASWLSREILFATLFTLLLLLLAAATSLRSASPFLLQALILLAALSGLSLVYSMARVYLLPGPHAWDRRSTLAAFLLTPLLLGSLGAALALSAPASGLADPSAARQSALLALLALVLAAAQILPGARRPTPPPPGYTRPSPWPLRRLRLRLALLIMSAVLLAAWLILPAAPVLRSAALLLALAAELIGRFHFYTQRRAML